jgi:hypothetical protein
LKTPLPTLETSKSNVRILTDTTELFGPLRDRCVFQQVRLDEEAHTLVWPNGADFDPATLYDWPRYAEAFAARAKQWQLASA